ncbi:MAG: ABC transporter ATP-binding protein [Victivallales bacterium]|nr:ABC transporter ATP-binding protein [Victivallales bacterium]
MTEILKVENLSSGYKDENIINNINFSANKGDLVGIIGPNGSGKTTLLRTVTGLLKPSRGNIFVQKDNLSSLTSKEIAKRIAVVTQNIEPVLINVSEYVLMGRMPYYDKFQFFEKNQDKYIAGEYMKMTDVMPYKNKMMSEISGGERQRAQVARALVQQPVLLLLDEPTSHLDITHQVKILDLIKRLNRELQLTVVLVIHDLNMAAEYCSKLLMLKKGEVFQTGPPEQVLTYKNIEEVYETVVIVEKNPLTQKPYVLPVTENATKGGAVR